jgi:hypothetical protein
MFTLLGLAEPGRPKRSSPNCYPTERLITLCDNRS